MNIRGVGACHNKGGACGNKTAHGIAGNNHNGYSCSGSSNRTDVEEPGKEEHQIVSEPSTKSVYSNITSVETVHQVETVVMVDMDRVHQT